MDEIPGPELLLGRHTAPVERYAPELLYPISREEGRRKMAGEAAGRLRGADIWHAYEISWLDAGGTPQSRVGRFVIPASSPNIVESKSLKLYLNSLNNERYPSEADLLGTLVKDIGAVVGSEVSCDLYQPGDPLLSGVEPEGVCIDDLALAAQFDGPNRDLLRTADDFLVEEQLYSHLMRSLCPVTGQPDWATISLHYSGPAIDRQALLAYIVSYRRHRDFHEQCIERIFLDIQARCAPTRLSVQGFYTRRGGLDISPYRSTDEEAPALVRLNRQ